jgi:hypothetical protein
MAMLSLCMSYRVRLLTAFYQEPPLPVSCGKEAHFKVPLPALERFHQMGAERGLSRLINIDNRNGELQ